LIAWQNWNGKIEMFYIHQRIAKFLLFDLLFTFIDSCINFTSFKINHSNQILLNIFLKGLYTCFDRIKILFGVFFYIYIVSWLIFENINPITPNQINTFFQHNKNQYILHCFVWISWKILQKLIIFNIFRYFSTKNWIKLTYYISNHAFLDPCCIVSHVRVEIN
jgi:hypothetical protein